MATSTVSVSFADGFAGDYSKNNEAINSQYMSALGWSKLQFAQTTDNGQFGGTQGNDYSGQIIVTDALGVVHTIDGVINWRAPSGSVSTMVFYATGSSQTLATTGGGSYTIDPFTETIGDPHTFLGLTFNGATLSISGGDVSGNAATAGLLSTLNTYLAAQPQLSIGDASVNESDGGVDVTVTLSKASADTVTVNYATSDGTATTAGNDYTAAVGSLTFAPGQTSKVIHIAIGADATPEASETFSVTLSASSFAAITDNTGVVTINAQNAPAAVTVNTVLAEDAAHTGASPVDSSVEEGAGLLYTVALSGATSGATEYALVIGGTASAYDYGSFTFSDGVAWKNGDAGTGIVVVPASVSGFTITVPTADDALVQNARSLSLTVGGVTASGTITDNDSVSVASVTAEDAAHTGASPLDSSVVEGASLRYTVALNSAGPNPTEHTLAIGGTASTSDYGSFTFSDGVAWKDGDPHTGIIVVPASVSGFTITVATVDDAQVENAESLTLTIGGVAASGTITDNDSQSVTSVTVENAANPGATPLDSSVVEGGTLHYTVALNSGSPNATEHTLAISGTAAADDYSSITFSDGVAWKDGDPATGVVVVPANVSGFAITVVTRDDSRVENTESLTLTVGGVAGTGTIVDNDVAPQAPVTVPDMSVKVGPATDGGSGPLAASAVTIFGAGQLTEGGSVRLLTSSGAVVESSVVTAEQVQSGQVHLSGMVLDDGVYTFTAQILDSAGNVTAHAPITMKVVTDVDGIMPSEELAANGGDFNHDGIPDWQQNNVAQLPLASVAAFQQGKLAPAASFGAIMAGQVDAAHPDAPVHLAAGAQLLNLSVSAPAAPLPEHVTAATPLLHFSVTQQSGGQPLADIAPGEAGLQVRVVIDLQAGGVQANDFLKWNSKTGAWYSFLDDQNLATADNGATLLDLNGDGKVDRIVVTLTDGGPGDEDGLVNGTIVDPGMLVQRAAAAPAPPPPVVPAAPAATPVLSVLLSNGDRYYTTDAAQAAHMAQGTGNVFEGARFDSLAADAGGHHLDAAFQPYTQDWYFAAPGQAMPYSCYNVVAGAAGFGAAAAGAAGKVDVHLYQNGRGMTQLLSSADAGALGLAAKGYADHGAVFSTTQDSAFVFDPEGYLLANQGNAAVQALVRQLAGTYSSVSDARFVDAVEQSYLSQVQLVGVQHGGAAGAAELNAAFGTHFGN